MPVLKEDKHSYCDTNKIYAKKGDKVTVIVNRPESHVLIVEDKNGVRFACTKDEII